jgi:hypothetical protein
MVLLVAGASIIDWTARAPSRLEWASHKIDRCFNRRAMGMASPIRVRRKGGLRLPGHFSPARLSPGLMIPTHAGDLSLRNLRQPSLQAGLPTEQRESAAR